MTVRRKCVRCSRYAESGWRLCIDCGCLAKQAEDDRVLLDRTDRKEFLSGGGRTTPPQDDWRALVYDRSSLQRPFNLFPARSLTWRKIVPSPRAAMKHPSISYYEGGLWPVEFRCAHVQLKNVVERLLSSLTVQEEYVLRLRFGIGMIDEHSIEEIAEDWHLSRARVWQIQEVAMRKLRSPRLSKFLVPFADGVDPR